MAATTEETRSMATERQDKRTLAEKNQDYFQ